MNNIDKKFSEIETAFRLWAFHTYYERSLTTVADNSARFAMAIVQSSRPVSREQIMEWASKIDEVKKANRTHRHRISRGRKTEDDE